jgi:hypothetical protein
LTDYCWEPVKTWFFPKYRAILLLRVRGGKSQAISLWANSTEKIVQFNEEEMMSKNLLIIILMGMFWGCTINNTVGQPFDTNAVKRIDLGKTTESEVISMLGAPLSEQKMENGIVIYSYSYGDRKSLGAESAVDSLQIQIYKGVVINKSQTLAH